MTERKCLMKCEDKILKKLVFFVKKSTDSRIIKKHMVKCYKTFFRRKSLSGQHFSAKFDIWEKFRGFTTLWTSYKKLVKVLLGANTPPYSSRASAMNEKGFITLPHSINLYILSKLIRSVCVCVCVLKEKKTSYEHLRIKN